MINDNEDYWDNPSEQLDQDYWMDTPSLNLEIVKPTPTPTPAIVTVMQGVIANDFNTMDIIDTFWDNLENGEDPFKNIDMPFISNKH